LATGLSCGIAALSLIQAGVHAQSGRPEDTASPATLTQAAAAQAQAAAPTAPAGLLVGPATVERHWSKYRYPESIPDGATYYIIVRGDTLWDISGRFLGNPFLWPQIWDANRYITDAHWIYPGDPLILPKVALLADRAGEEPPTPEDEAGAEGAAGAGAGGPSLIPAIEHMALQCAHYVVDSEEDTSLYVIGSEQGATKVAYSERDILYLSKGSADGIRAGDMYSLHHPSYEVKHPDSGRRIGTKVETTGAVRVILVQDNSATAIVEAACMDIHLGDFLKPYQRVAVPTYLRHAPPNRTTPPSGKIEGAVVDVAHDSMIAGQEDLVTINVGREHGIAPGALFTVFKVMYPSVPTSRNVIGELVVVAVQERTSTAKLIYTSDAVMNGDRVELQ
jgi:hypothetical protein